MYFSDLQDEIVMQQIYYVDCQIFISNVAIDTGLYKKTTSALKLHRFELYVIQMTPTVWASVLFQRTHHREFCNTPEEIMRMY